MYGVIPPVPPVAPLTVTVDPTHISAPEAGELNVILVGGVGSAFTVIVVKAGMDQPQHRSRSWYLTMYVPAVVNGPKVGFATEEVNTVVPGELAFVGAVVPLYTSHL